VCREKLTGNDLFYSLGKELDKLEQLCPWATSFDYNMPRLSSDDSFEIIDATLVHPSLLVGLISRLLIMVCKIWLGLGICA
jgi:hypothetical protein